MESLFLMESNTSNNKRHRSNQLPRKIEMQELIRTMSIGTWAQDPSNNELSFWPDLVKLTHNWNTATFGNSKPFIAEEDLRRFIDEGL